MRLLIIPKCFYVVGMREVIWIPGRIVRDSRNMLLRGNEP
jgi:hypothetical protein